MINKKAILAALRSDKYKQNVGALYDPYNKAHCCIAVSAQACGIDLIQHGEVRCTAEVSADLGYNKLRVSKDIARSIGYSNNSPVTLESVLITLNDNWRWKFDQIADFLEMVLPDEH